ncbi:MAG: AAA family ATPase [Candidatus Thiodiazotropha endolucinida]
MSIFEKATNTQAFLKCGIMGFAGSGKTYTASKIAVGLVHYMRDLELESGNNPVMFLDTETGSDWVQPMFNQEGIELFTAKTRAFKNLIPAVREAEKNGSVLLIDSISHFWRELTESYAERKNRKYGLQFQDWAWLKQTWGQFTDIFVNSNAHIIMCGRAGYEYDFFEQEGGKKELEKTGIKMKAETETGYEPSILILMDKHMDMDNKTTYRTANVLKDRADLIDGKTFRNPTFENILPHIQFLNLGGQHLGVDTSEDSKSMISRDSKSEWQIQKEEKEVRLDEIQTLMVSKYPSTSKEDKLAKFDLLQRHFNTKSWKRVETYSLDKLDQGYDSLHMELVGRPAFGKPDPDLDKPENNEIPMGDELPPEDEKPTAEEKPKKDTKDKAAA